MNELSATRNEVTVVSATKDFDGNSALTPIRSKTPEANPEGIFYQLQAEQQQAAHRRKHFFSPPPPILADAVNKDADSVEYTPEEEVSEHHYLIVLLVADLYPTERGFAQDRCQSVDINCSQVCRKYDTIPGLHTHCFPAISVRRITQ